MISARTLAEGILWAFVAFVAYEVGNDVLMIASWFLP